MTPDPATVAAAAEMWKSVDGVAVSMTGTSALAKSAQVLADYALALLAAGPPPEVRQWAIDTNETENGGYLVLRREAAVARWILSLGGPTK